MKADLFSSAYFCEFKLLFRIYFCSLEKLTPFYRLKFTFLHITAQSTSCAFIIVRSVTQNHAPFRRNRIHCASQNNHHSGWDHFIRSITAITWVRNEKWRSFCLVCDDKQLWHATESTHFPIWKSLPSSFFPRMLECHECACKYVCVFASFSTHKNKIVNSM